MLKEGFWESLVPCITRSVKMKRLLEEISKLRKYDSGPMIHIWPFKVDEGLGGQLSRVNKAIQQRRLERRAKVILFFP